RLKEVLEEAVRPEPEWWLNGDPRIKGTISTMQRNVDVNFRIKGSKGIGTLYFTSIRREKEVPFTKGTTERTTYRSLTYYCVFF
ncbi:hypothetical protein K435DRAFT_665098, partial [Dendrothele bispora CBS 962.96]